MKLLDLQPIKERVEKAAVGEWVYDSAENEIRCGVYLIAKDTEYTADAEFIAHARQDVPRLVAEVERLREELEDVQEQLFTVRGKNKLHDGEITGLCIQIRQALDGESDG